MYCIGLLMRWRILIASMIIIILITISKVPTSVVFSSCCFMIVCCVDVPYRYPEYQSATQVSLSAASNDIVVVVSFVPESLEAGVLSLRYATCPESEGVPLTMCGWYVYTSMCVIISLFCYDGT